MKGINYPLIAEGRTAEIFLWDEKHVLKLYRDWCPAARLHENILPERETLMNIIERSLAT